MIVQMKVELNGSIRELLQMLLNGGSIWVDTPFASASDAVDANPREVYRAVRPLEEEPSLRVVKTRRKE